MSAPRAVSVDELARRVVESGRLNWSGPATIVLVVSDGEAVMIPEAAKQCVDAAFATPRPALTLELVDADGRGWPAAWLALEYAQRRAEWGNRGLSLIYRTPAAPSAARAERLAASHALVRAALSADGPASAARIFPASRARVVVGPGARDPEGWADALASARVEGVEWVRGPKTPPARFDAFVARALKRIVDRAETSDLRDETVVALLRERPWEIPGVDLLETLAFGPDGSVFSSEEGLRLAAGGEGVFALGHASDFKFAALPELPVVPALISAAVNEGQPLCAGCRYKSYCAIAPSAHYRDQGSLAGRLPDSPNCGSRLSVLNAVFSRISDEKCLKALQKWGVDISHFTC